MSRHTPRSNMAARWRASALRAGALGVLSSLVLVVPAPAANIVVDTLEGNGLISDNDCSLHEAILAVITSGPRGGCPGGDPGVTDTITLAVTGTITLSDALPAINQDLHLIGPGARLLTISGNSIRQVLRVNAGVNVTVEGVTISRGRAIQNGGGILNFGRLTVRNTSFVENQAPEDGGAISNEGRGARLTVLNSTFSGNSGIEAGREQEEGGAIVNIDGEATIVNSTFVGNHAPNTGGAIHNSEPTAEVTLINCTITGNSAAAGGGAVFTERGGEITLRNTLLAANPGNNCGVASTGGRIIDQEGNLDDGSTCGLAPGMSIPNGAAGLDLAGLQNHGGPTDTIALTAASDAIDWALDSVCAAAPVNNLDQRGPPFVRPIDGDGDGSASCDIGAFESERPPPQPAPPAQPPSSPPPSPLVEAVPVGENPRLQCTRSSCRVLIRCIVIQSPGAPCSDRFDVFVRDSVLRDHTPAKAPGRIRFATGRAEIAAGTTADVKLRLTKRGRQFVRTGKKTRIKGVLEIRNDSGTSIVKRTRVTLRIKRR
ncbi:MAG: choice-of-anchor Q domain-containing protein [Gammaproteobacteria bacterium]